MKGLYPVERRLLHRYERSYIRRVTASPVGRDCEVAVLRPQRVPNRIGEKMLRESSHLSIMHQPAVMTIHPSA